MQLTEDQLKQIEALCRAMPVSRMVDYGMPRELADFAHRLVREGAPWDQVLQQLAHEQEARARAEEDPSRARDAWHVAAASMIFAQMAFNADDERKRGLYGQMTRYFTRFAALSEFQVSRIEIPYRDGTLFGWHFHASGETSGTVIVSDPSIASIGKPAATCPSSEISRAPVLSPLLDISSARL